ncbi:MAG: YraN family protein [Candidatus Eisenbacteria bacterium]
MAMGSAQDRGRAGEALAAAYLQLVGCHEVARNVRLGGVEVDLVVDDGPSRVLVEVRLRSRADFGGAAATLDRRKCDRLRRAASALEQLGVRHPRIDAVTIDLTPSGAVLTHHRNAVTD